MKDLKQINYQISKLSHFQIKFNLKKICVISVLFFLFQIVYAQDSGLNKSISINVKNKPIADVIKEISEKSGVNFSYSTQQIPVDRKVSVRAKDKPVKEILEQLLKSNGIDFMLVEKQVILKSIVEEAPVVKAEEQVAEKKKYTISGYLKDKKTGEVLIGASVFAKGTTLGTMTNAYGFYSLTIPEGNYNLFFSYIGYRFFNREIDLKKDENIIMELESSTEEINEIVVIAEDVENEIRENQLSEMKLTPKTLSQMTGFVGEVDVVKSLQSVPGIKSYGDGSTLFYVRGGSSDQNLILIDEAPIYNPSHLFGFFTAFAPDAIKDVQAYKGDFPASYGGRLSSVIDIRTKDGNMKHFGFSGSLGPFTSNLTFEGPIWKDRCSFFVSGRRSNLNWLQSRKAKSFDINFYDINAKLNFKINDKNRIFFSVYRGADEFSKLTTGVVRTFGISWDNILGTLRWNHVFNDKLFSNTTFYRSRYNYYLYISKDDNEYWNSSIDNLSFKTDFTWYLNPKNTIKTGLHINTQLSNPGNVHFSDVEIQRYVPSVPRYQSLEYAFYASNDQELTKKWSLRYGVRIPVWQNIGPTKIFYFNENYQVQDVLVLENNSVYKTIVNVEPRVNVAYMINNLSSLKASYTRTTQCIHLISNSVSPFTSMEVWIPSGPNIKPSIADQFATGWFRHFISTGLDVSAETFYKNIQNQIDYKDHANLLFNPLIEGELRFGKAWAYGIELMLRRQEGRFAGWIGYTYSRTFRKIDGVNNNNTYPANFDRPHNICLNLSYNTEKKWVFTANWIYLTGSAFSSPTGFYYYNGYSVPIYDAKNNDRLPDYHRLDLSITYNFNKSGAKFRHSLMFTVYNLYARNNPISVNFNKIIDDNGKFVVPSDLSGNRERVPTAISVAGMIPSITYNFKF